MDPSPYRTPDAEPSPGACDAGQGERELLPVYILLWLSILSAFLCAKPGSGGAIASLLGVVLLPGLIWPPLRSLVCRRDRAIKET